MRKEWMSVTACLIAGCALAPVAVPQSGYSNADQMPAFLTSPVGAAAAGQKGCECGAHPPGPPKDRLVEPYAGQPADLSPFEKFANPYFANYTHPNVYSGAGRDIPEPKDVSEVRIGFFGPIEHSPNEVYGKRMLHGVQLAMEEANARGGYNGKPYKLMLHNDYDNWQAKAVYGEERPTDPTIWGSPSNETVKMIYDDKDWAIFGSINSESTHIVLRVALRGEIPIVNSASTDPTIPETYIPWYFTDIQDDRVQYLHAGSPHVHGARTQAGGHSAGQQPIWTSRRSQVSRCVQKARASRCDRAEISCPGDTDFTHQLKVIRGSRTDAIVLWAMSSGGRDSQADARAGNEAAGLWRVSYPGRNC